MIQIREFREGDTDALYDIALRSFDEYFEPSVFSYFRTQWRTGQLVACDVTGRPVGFIAGTRLESRKVRIMLFGVLPEYRNMGVGRQLLDAFRLRAMMEGNISIILEVRTTNEGARRFYRRNGFMETDILMHYYRDGGDGVRMAAPVQMNQ